MYRPQYNSVLCAHAPEAFSRCLLLINGNPFGLVPGKNLHMIEMCSEVYCVMVRYWYLNKEEIPMLLFCFVGFTHIAPSWYIFICLQTIIWQPKKHSDSEFSKRGFTSPFYCCILSDESLCSRVNQ